MIRVLCCAFLSLAAPLALAAPCTICTDGSAPQGKFGGIDCADFEADLASTDADSPVCSQLQLEAFQYCSCPSFPDNQFCPLCENGFYEIPNPRRPIVGWMNEKDGSYLTCDDVLFGDMTRDGECERNALAAYYCGCPEALPPVTACSLCPETQDAISLELLIDDPEAPTPSPQAIVLDRRVPPLFDITCDDYRQAADLFEDVDSCSVLGKDLPVHLRHFCGCKVDIPADRATDCSLCPVGRTLLEDETTLLAKDNQTVVSCAEWDVVASSVVDETYCSETIAPLVEACCSAPDGEVAPTETTTSEEDSTPPEAEEEPKSLAASLVSAVAGGALAAASLLVLA